MVCVADCVNLSAGSTLLVKLIEAGERSGLLKDQSNGFFTLSVMQYKSIKLVIILRLQWVWFPVHETGIKNGLVRNKCGCVCE